MPWSSYPEFKFVSGSASKRMWAALKGINRLLNREGHKEKRKEMLGEDFGGDKMGGSRVFLWLKYRVWIFGIPKEWIKLLFIYGLNFKET